MAFTLTLDPAAYINLDLFPATVRSESGTFVPTHEEYRVIVTDSHFYVIDDTINGPDAIVRVGLVEFAKTGKKEYTVTSDTDTFYIERATNCGCGSRLRGIHPFAGVPFISQLKK